MTKTMTEDERKATLKSLGLNPDAPGLADLPAKITTQVVPETPTNHTTPASEIVFDPTLLDQFEVLDGAGMASASRYLFDLYKSPHRDKERHALLHRRISEFIQQVRRNRQTGGLVPVEPVKDKIKATKEQRDIAALLAAKGLTAADLAALLHQEA